MVFLSLASSGACSAADQRPRVALTRLADRVRIEVDGSMFTEYVFSGAPRPYLHPIIAADGTPLTRDFPMIVRPEEAHDHVHHRSLWFAHGSVNGHDFWMENPRAGRIEHVALVETTGSETGVLRARNRWVGADGTVVCTDEQTLRVHHAAQGRILDYEVTIQADHGPVTFGDTKEGTMAVRVAQWMALRRADSPVDAPPGGHIVNSAGDQDRAAWGKPANWVDYFAPHGGRTYGIAIFDHPQNPRHPTWWHVRDYGLFAANPFGRHDFESRRDEPHLGDLTIPAGGNLTFRYRFYFHEGDTAAARIAEQFTAYATGKPLALTPLKP